MPSLTSVITASVATAAVGVAGVSGLVVIGVTAGDQATVVKIVDGDTIDVRYDGAEHRVRLLNIDTPEMGGKTKDAECLAPEAKRYVQERIPVGSGVRLMWDRDHDDSYGRQLRGVFSDGLVNADIVRNGLAVPMHIDPNERYKDDIDEAFAEASASKRGFFDPSQECAVAARTERVDAATAAGDMTTARGEAAALLILLDDPDSFAARALGPSSRAEAMTHLKSVFHRPATSTAKKTTKPRRPKTRTSTPDHSRAPKPSRKPKPKPAPTATVTTTTPLTTPTPAPSRTQAPPPPARTTPPPPSSTYTPPPPPRSTSTPAPPPPASTRPNNAAPCRSYAPGGKTFTYIDCDTRQPL
ncbi:thermonuclease family protein [Janibacter limosus]|uniref:thermonuclease family protein n=1 Tax=Janibacter limosus TaxID=53458 RepID=UPI00147031EB|nr:thermonuclease family protein [Janibacter limosus]